MNKYTTTKYLIFEKEQKKNKKTFDIKVFNHDSTLLGLIYWRAGWRTYVFNPSSDMIFDIKCLNDITKYITELLEERKKNRLEESNHAI